MSAGLPARAHPSPALTSLDIGHPVYAALVDPDIAFWALVDKTRLADTLAGAELLELYRRQPDACRRELQALRFDLQPSGVYLNPTERCNLNCAYCYLPATQRRSCRYMFLDVPIASLGRLRDYFRSIMPDGRKHRVIFHGAEPLMNRDAVFAATGAFAGGFGFGVQTNGTLLDDRAVDFLTTRNLSIGLSLDGPFASITDATRPTWSGRSMHDQVLAAMDRLRGYGLWSVITTCTTENLPHLTAVVELSHTREVPTCMLNTVRCTLPGARTVRPADAALAHAFFAALARTHAGSGGAGGSRS